MTQPTANTEAFTPRMVGIVCNWCTYTGADLAGTSRLKYEPAVRMVRVPCTGRIDFHLILKAFETGADGVIVSGCHPNDCHYNAGNFHARRRFAAFRELLGFLGIDQRRLQFFWVSAAEGAKWRDVVNKVTTDVRQIGPFTQYQRMITGAFGEALQKSELPTPLPEEVKA